MAYSDFASFKQDIQKASLRFPYLYYGWTNSLPVRFVDPIATSSQASALPAGMVAPTTAVTCNKSTVGAINSQLPNFTPSSNFIIKATLSDTYAQSNSFVWIVDRLSHQGNIAINTSTPQTTNLPTAALTRYTDGVGVMIGVTAYGSTSGSPTITVTYTNQSGVSSRISPIQNLSLDIWEFRPLALQQGDYGVRSVESVTIGNVSSSTSKIGISLFKPICMYGSNLFNENIVGDYDFISGNILGGIPSFDDNACLIPMIQNLDTNISGLTSSASGELVFGAN